MAKPKGVICYAVVCSMFAVQVQAQTLFQSQEIVRYSGEYVLAAGNNAALFTGRLQSRLPDNLESLYLRDKGFVERDSRGIETIPKQVSPSESYSVGDLFYDGILYVGVKMRLDLYRDEFVVAGADGSSYGSVLNPDRFGYADMRGYRIVHITSLSSPDLPEGYYLQLHEGRHTILKKESFMFDFSKKIFTGQLIRYYLERNGTYFRVGNRKGSALSLFRDRRSELDRYIRTNRLDMRNDAERSLVEIVREYERLTDR